MIPVLGRKRERQILGASWPVSLVYLLSSRPVRNPVSKRRYSIPKEGHERVVSGLHMNMLIYVPIHS